MLDKRSVLLAKDESAYNADSAPVAATDAIMIEDLAWAFANARMQARKPVRASLGLLKSVFAGTLISVSGKTEVKGSGAAGTAPEIAPLLRASGWAETVNAGVSVLYKPSSTQSVHKSSTMYFYDDGLLLKITGARGTCSFDLQVGAAIMCNWEFTGHFVSITDVALPVATYDSTVPPMLVNVPFTVGGFAAVISKLAFDMGVELSIPENIAATDGYGEIQITGRNPTGSFNPLRVTVATKNFISEWQSGAALVLTTGDIGSVAGNKVKVDMPAITYTEIARGNQNNVGTYENTFEARESAGDDEVTLTFT
jgi:hypothetical protein